MIYTTQYVQCFEFFSTFYFSCVVELKKPQLHCFGWKTYSKKKTYVSIFSYSQRIVKLAQCLTCFTNDHRLCKRTIFSVKVQNNTYIIISHQSFSYRFPFIFDNSSFHCNLQYCSVQGIYLQASKARSDIFSKVKQKCQFAVLIILMGAC